MDERAYAKLNLALHVRGREPDGYHRIETLFVFAEDGDQLRAGEGEGLTLALDGPYAGDLPEGADNLVMRAAERLRERFAVRLGAALRLTKYLPVASGIGGGSADAAAALRLLARFWKLSATESELSTIASALGADVPACLLSRAARGTGRGERLVVVEDSSVSGMPLLLVNPGIALATASVFRAWDGVDRGPLPDGPLLEAALAGRNDLEQPAIAMVPQIASVLQALRSGDGALLARMSGSGATCFALFGSARHRDETAARIAAEHPSWWQMATRLR